MPTTWRAAPEPGHASTVSFSTRRLPGRERGPSSYPWKPSATTRLEALRQIYNLLRLREPENIDDLAAKYTGPENPVAPGGRTIHMLRRDSRTLSNAWKVQMPRQDAERVRALTEETFRRIYPDWEGVPQDLSLVPSPIP